MKTKGHVLCALSGAALAALVMSHPVMAAELSPTQQVVATSTSVSQSEHVRWNAYFFTEGTEVYLGVQGTQTDLPEGTEVEVSGSNSHYWHFDGQGTIRSDGTVAFPAVKYGSLDNDADAKKVWSTGVGVTISWGDGQSDSTGLWVKAPEQLQAPLPYTHTGADGQLKIGVNGSPGPWSIIGGIPVTVYYRDLISGLTYERNGSLRSDRTVAVADEPNAIVGDSYQISLRVVGGYTTPAATLNP